MKNGDENDEIGLNLENLELLKFESAWLWPTFSEVVAPSIL
jgi:hypothetical protein